jgi:hypothetical protein
MTLITNSTVIRCTSEEAFDFLSDHRSELEWNPRVEAMEKITDGPVGVGTRYRAKWKISPQVEVETIAFDRPRGWAAHNDGPVEVTVTARLEPVADGTRLLSDFDAHPHGWFRLIFPLFLLRMRREEKANMTYLREALERRAAARVR